MSADLAVQKAIRARLVAAPAVTALVPVASILDRNKRPAPDPSIILGETTVSLSDGIDRDRVTVWHTVHVWKTEPSLEGVKRIMGAIGTALAAPRLDLSPAYHAVDWKVTSARALRDPDGQQSHGVLTIEIEAQEVPS